MKGLSSDVVRRLRDHARASQAEMGDAIGVSAQAVNLWEHGGTIGPFNRMRLLEYAKKVSAPKDILREIEAAQPEVRV